MRIDRRTNINPGVAKITRGQDDSSMKLPFRHGIVKYNIGNDKIPTFLSTNKYDTYANITIANDIVLFVVAHNDVNYLYQETKSVSNAWGPFNQNIKYWLYWDLSLLTGKRTFGATTLIPVTDYFPPENPANDQHWFDLKNNVMKFYENGNWITCLRVFAGTYYNGEVIAYPLSSQVGLFDECRAGFIMYSDQDTPHQQARDDGSFKFLTTELHYDEVKAVVTTVSLNGSLHSGVAALDLPKYTIVTFNDNTLIKASYNDPQHRTAVGIVLNDISSGQKTLFETQGYVTNPTWNWKKHSGPIYLGLDGTLTEEVPKIGFIQKIGFVVSTDTVYIDTTYQVVYHNTFIRKVPVPLNLDTKTGKFVTKYPVTDDMTISVYYNTFHNVYQQPVDNNTWLIKHTRALDNFLVQTYDSRGHMVIPNNITRIDKNTLQVEFNKKTTGFVKVVSY